MGPSAAVVALAGVLLGAVEPDVAIGSRLELMAGSAPVVPTEAPRAAFAAELSPLAALELEDRRFRLVVRYNPRFFLREPNMLGLDRPILLHRATVSELVAVSRTVTFRNSIEGSAGEVDYIGLAAVLPPTQSGQLRITSVTRLYDVQDTASLEVHTSGRAGYLVSALAGKSGPMDTPSPLPVHTRVGGSFEYRYQASPIDRLRTPSFAEYHRFDTVSLALQGTELDWEHRASSRTTTTLGAGAQVTEPIDTSVARTPGSAVAPVVNDSTTIAPIVTAGVVHGLYVARGERLDGRLSTSVRSVPNLAAAEYRPVASLQAALEFMRPPHWTATLRATYSTTATATPLPGNPPETFFIAEMPIIYTVNPNLALEWGARSLFLAPHVKNGFDVEQLQIWGYAAVTVLFGTERDPRDVTR